MLPYALTRPNPPSGSDSSRPAPGCPFTRARQRGREVHLHNSCPPPLSNLFRATALSSGSDPASTIVISHTSCVGTLCSHAPFLEPLFAISGPGLRARSAGFFLSLSVLRAPSWYGIACSPIPLVFIVHPHRAAMHVRCVCSSPSSPLGGALWRHLRVSYRLPDLGALVFHPLLSVIPIPWHNGSLGAPLAIALEPLSV